MLLEKIVARLLDAGDRDEAASVEVARWVAAHWPNKNAQVDAASDDSEQQP